MPTEDLPLDGKHNVLNIMAATDSFLAHSSIDPRSLKQGLSTFSNVEHRIEKVRVLEGVTFINDSKATNVNAVWYALESIKNPIIWLVGGKDKGNDYEILKDFVASKVSDIICIGKDNKAIIKAFDDCTAKPIMEIADMTKAVNYAYTQAKDGYTILLSPACSSFDLYENYQKRGDAFRRAAVRVRRENMY